MKRASQVAGILLAAAVSLPDVGVAGVSGFNGSNGSIGFVSSWNNLSRPDPPGSLFPGKYFEYKAQFYLRKHDYAEALRLFELAGFWANKRAQYNAAMMYYKGIGVPADPLRGVAWLGIAAENHDDLSQNALQTAYAALSPIEKTEADKIFRTLDEKYGDAVAIPRALKQFNHETRDIIGSHVGYRGLNTVIAENGSDDPSYRPVAYFTREQDKQLDALISSVTGHVTVGQVVTLPVPPPKN
jgi:hypothetical protein